MRGTFIHQIPCNIFIVSYTILESVFRLLLIGLSIFNYDYDRLIVILFTLKYGKSLIVPKFSICLQSNEHIHGPRLVYPPLTLTNIH